VTNNYINDFLYFHLWLHLISNHFYLKQDEYKQIKRMIMPAFVVGHKTNNG